MAHRDVAAVDIGGTKILAGAVDVDRGTVGSTATRPSRPDRGTDAVLADIAGALRAVLADNDEIDERVGIAVPEIVDAAGEFSSNVTLTCSRSELRDALDLPSPPTIISDVMASALAEARLGAGRGRGSFVFLSVGTGVSSAFVIDGRPWFGVNGAALVASSGRRSLVCPACAEQISYVPESMASGAGILQAYRARSGDEVVAEARGVFQRAGRGDALARETIGHAGHMLGVVAAGIVDLLDPATIVVGGGLGLTEGRYWESFESSLRTHIWADAARGVPVVRSALGPNAALVGAALAATIKAPLRTRSTATPAERSDHAHGRLGNSCASEFR